ncbi:MAG: hypothetical protein QOD56_1646 [Gammaproteobacteria bacterium]|nr:hypothetical protein [Gammaproteobacteria bacterium]
MKVTHSNQTLILASERRGQGGTSESTLDRAVNAASQGGTLKRVTIVATQPDAGIVYVRADYAAREKSPGEPAAGTYGAPQPTSTALTTLSNPVASTPWTPDRTGSLVPSPGSSAAKDTYGNQQSLARDTGLTAYLKPAEQYARTQRIQATASHPSLIDVLA